MPSRPLNIARLCGAFSLLETVVSMAVVSFTVIGMLGLFPVGFKQASASILESHGAQLAQEIFSALRTPPTESPSLDALNLSALESTDAPLILHADFPLSGAPSIGTAETDDSLYTVELNFETMKPQADATRVTVTLFPRTQPSEKLHFQSIVARP